MSIRELMAYVSTGEYDCYDSQINKRKPKERRASDSYTEYYKHEALEKKNKKLKHQLRNLQQQNTRFLNDIDEHPSLTGEWKRFCVLYKTITGKMPDIEPGT